MFRYEGLYAVRNNRRPRRFGRSCTVAVVSPHLSSSMPTCQVEQGNGSHSLAVEVTKTHIEPVAARSIISPHLEQFLLSLWLWLCPLCLLPEHKGDNSLEPTYFITYREKQPIFTFENLLYPLSSACISYFSSSYLTLLPAVFPSIDPSADPPHPYSWLGPLLLLLLLHLSPTPSCPTNFAPISALHASILPSFQPVSRPLADGLRVGLFPQQAADLCTPALWAGEICSIVSPRRSPLYVEVVWMQAR